MFSLDCNLTKNDVKFLSVKISPKKIGVNNVGFSTIKITSKKVSRNNVDFSTREITSKKKHGNNVDFLTIELCLKKYVEKTLIFRLLNLRREKYVETTWIFRSAKLHRKSTWKWRGNSSKFDLRRIDVIPTSNRRGFDVVCPLGCLYCCFGHMFCKDGVWEIYQRGKHLWLSLFLIKLLDYY